MSAFWSSPPSKPRSRGTRPVRVVCVAVFIAALMCAAWAWPEHLTADVERVAALWGVSNAAVLWLAATWERA